MTTHLAKPIEILFVIGEEKKIVMSLRTLKTFDEELSFAVVSLFRKDRGLKCYYLRLSIGIIWISANKKLFKALVAENTDFCLSGFVFLDNSQDKLQ